MVTMTMMTTTREKMIYDGEFLESMCDDSTRALEFLADDEYLRRYIRVAWDTCKKTIVCVFIKGRGGQNWRR